MEKQLNLSRLQLAMSRAGLTQSAVAAALDLTRASVSKWFTGKSFPRPPELLRLGRLVGMAHDELVTTVAGPAQPLIAFRRRAATKTTQAHITRAQEMGRLLRPLVPHLPFNAFVGPARLKQPSLEYHYIQRLVADLRRELKVEPTGVLKFEQLIGKFTELQAVLIPVLWGQKARHENALHIYLPDSKTTWVYVNLDSHLHDFKFWMAHELGHLLSVDLLERQETELAEDFADTFAGALIFPEAAAIDVYAEYQGAKTDTARIAILLKAATAWVISPFSVYCEVEKYARARSLPFTLSPSGRLHATITQFNQAHPSVSASLFAGRLPSAKEYIARSKEVFQTPFFDALHGYLLANPKPASLVSRLLDIPLVDGKALQSAMA